MEELARTRVLNQMKLLEKDIQIKKESEIKGLEKDHKHIVDEMEFTLNGIHSNIKKGVISLNKAKVEFKNTHKENLKNYEKAKKQYTNHQKYKRAQEDYDKSYNAYEKAKLNKDNANDALKKLTGEAKRVGDLYQMDIECILNEIEDTKNHYYHLEYQFMKIEKQAHSDLKHIYAMDGELYCNVTKEFEKYWNDFESLVGSRA